MSEGIWTMTDSEFYQELAKAWQEGSTAERRWWIKVTKNEDATDPENPYSKGRPQWKHSS